MKDLKNQNKIIYSIANKYGSPCEIKKVWEKAYKNISHFSSDCSSGYPDHDSSLARNGSWDIYRRPDVRKEINKLYHVVNNNLNTNKGQSNEAINNEPTFDTTSFNLSRSTSDPLPVVTVSLQKGNKHRATTGAGLTCVWGSAATYSM